MSLETIHLGDTEELDILGVIEVLFGTIGDSHLGIYFVSASSFRVNFLVNILNSKVSIRWIQRFLESECKVEPVFLRPKVNLLVRREYQCSFRNVRSLSCEHQVSSIPSVEQQYDYND